MKLLKLKKTILWAVLLSSSCLFYSCTNSDSNITFQKDIAPILHKNCVPCHRPNGGAPFNLISYNDVFNRAKMIAFVTKAKYMPPWPADVTYSHFLNEKVLSENEIELIQRWFKTGKKAGDTALIAQPEILKYGSILGKPDMVLNLTPVSISNDNTDRFYVIKVPYQIPRDTFIRAVEFIPGQPNLVHHMNGQYFQFTTQTNPFTGSNIKSYTSNNFDAKNAMFNIINNDGSLPVRIHSAVNYLPGTFGTKYPKGIGGFKLTQKGAFLANDIHYGPSVKSKIDSSKIYLYFDNKPPKRPTFELMLGTNGVAPIIPALQIQPNTISKHTSQVTIYNDISILTINPHMHLIGTSFKAYAIKPNGDTVKLIYIPEWRFRWQYFYTFTKPVKIPKGSTIRVEAEYNNTVNNPNNPFNPPQLIGERLEFGGSSMRTTDEMLQFIITYMPYLKGDENIDMSTP